MNRNQEVRERLRREVLLFDGAMGTMLQARGLTPGVPPEIWNLDRPGDVLAVHRAYVQAGADILETNTFGGNPITLRNHGLEGKMAEINGTAVRLAREAAAEREGVLVAGSMGPTGKLLAPMGPLSAQEAYDAFARQAEVLAEAGVDLLLIETMGDLGEARQALLAVKAATDLPVICQMTFTGGRTLTGTDPETAAVVFEGLGADVVGVNCSTGPAEMAPIVAALVRATTLPVSVQPNAGLPQIEKGQTVYLTGPVEFARYIPEFIALGANIVGGCCGTTDLHIAAARRALERQGKPNRQGKYRENVIVGRLTSRSRTMEAGQGKPYLLIGERINPTARKKLAEAMTRRDWSMVASEAREQARAGARALDVNVGVPGEDEADLMQGLIPLLQGTVDLPLVLDTSNSGALETGLRQYVGRPLINSVNAGEESLAKVLPLAKRYGAAVLGLTLDERGIPAQAEERFRLAEKILNEALSYGLRPEDVFIDCLVLTAGAQQEEVLETIRALRLVKERLGLPTVLGVSNVSHGLPNRPLLNATFLAMALGAGLDAPIVNPVDARMQDALLAGAVLTARDPHARIYLAREEERRGEEPAIQGPILAQKPHPGAASLPGKGDAAEDAVARVQKAVLEGDREGILAPVEEALREGRRPLAIIEEGITPALMEVGHRYETRVYFLPQLMLAAETAQRALARLRQEMKEEEGPAMGTVIMATVKGDIHDIGKNIVQVMLANHGFRVVDLGKDVTMEHILEAAEKERASLIGLSALMTTTMPEMDRIIAEVRHRGLAAKVMVGGAAVTEEYARKIGADGYGRDAVEAVRQAKILAGNKG